MDEPGAIGGGRHVASDPLRSDPSTGRQPSRDRVHSGGRLVQHLVKPFEGKPVTHLFASALAADEAAVAQAGKVGADPRLRLSYHRDDLADGSLASAQEFEDLEPRRVSKDPEEPSRGHRLDRSEKAYTHIR